MSDSIQVAIKVRPLIKREKDDNLPIQWSIVDNAIVPTDPEKKRGDYCFQFDHIFAPDKNNSDVFNLVVKPIVNAAINGINGTVFAYGQTSSGKTHTMLGTPCEPGIIPMTVEHMFECIAETVGREFLLRVSYLEIYNERVNDLLDTANQDLKLREDNNGLVQVVNSKEEVASTPDNILSIMKKGDKNRSIGQTDMNERSSRSHSIFRITIESRDQSSDSDGAIQVSQLNLVDLAGSERARQTNATGERFKEGTHINMSLSTLGLVIKQLSESDSGSKYINFRDSKLTRLLQASLGGNAMTAIICAVTPAAFEETQCTLGFAQRAKSVKNKPIVNEVLSDAALLKRYKKQLAKLNEELERLKSDDKFQTVQEMESKLQEKEHKLQETDRINQLLEDRIQLLKNSIISAESATKDESNTKIPRSKRRRTWAGDRGLNSRMSLAARSTFLPTIKEMPTSPEFKNERRQKKQDKYNSRKSIIQTINLNDESFETAFTDFELELIKIAKEREEEDNFSMDSTLEKTLWRINPRSENRVKFHDDVEIHRLSSSSAWSDMSTPKRNNKNQETPPQGSPDTPKSVLRERIDYLTEEYKLLREFTTLERQVLSAQTSDFDSPHEKSFMQSQIDGLIKRLEEYSKYQAEMEEQLSVSLNCIHGFASITPDIMEEWKPTIFGIAKDNVDTYGELKQLEQLLEDFQNRDRTSEIEELKRIAEEKSIDIINLQQEKLSQELEFAEKLKSYEEQIDALKRQIESSVELETKMLTINTELTAKLRKLDDVNLVNVDLQHCIEQKSNEISNLQQEKVDQELQLSEKIKSLEEQIQVLQQRPESSAEMQEKISALNNDLSAKLKEIEELNAVNTDLQRTAEEKSTELSKLQQEKMSQELQFSEKIISLEEQINALRLQTEGSPDFESQISTLNNEVSLKLKEIEELNILITEFKKSAEEKATELSNTQQEKLSQELQFSEKIKSLEDQIESLKQQPDSAKNMEEKILQLNNELTAKLKEIEELNVLNAELKKCTEEKSVELLKMQQKQISQESQITEKTDTNGEQVNTSKDQLERIENLEASIVKLNDELTTKLKEIEELNLLNAELKKSADEKAVELSKMQQEQISKELELAEKIKSYEEQIHNFNQQSENLVELETKITSLNNELSAKLKEIEELRLLNDDLKKSLEEKSTELSCLLEDKLSQEMQIAEKIKSYEEQIQVIQQQADDSLELKAKITSLNDELTSKLKEIEELNSHITELEKCLEEKTNELSSLQEEKMSHELRISEKIRSYEEEINTLKQQSNSEELEEKILTLNNELSSKIKDIEDLNLLNTELKNCVEEKSNELVKVQQEFNLKLNELEQQAASLISEREDLKNKVESYVNTSQKLEKETSILKEINQTLKLENETLLQEFETECSKMESENDPGKTTVPECLEKQNTENIMDNSMKSLVLQMEPSMQFSTFAAAEKLEAPLNESVKNFVKPADKPEEDSKEKSKPSVTQSGQDINKKFELESSSIFANLTYFDNMEVSQTINEDFTNVYGLDMTETINISKLKKEAAANKTVANMTIAEENKIPETVSEVKKIEDESKAESIDKTLENSKSEDAQSTSMDRLVIPEGPLSMEELEQLRAVLEKENTRLRFDLQNKIQEAEDVKQEIFGFKKVLEELQQTIYKMTNENLEMSNQLTEERESKKQLLNKFMAKNEQLTSKIAALNEENASLNNDLATMNEQLDILRSKTPVISDEELKQKFYEYEEKIRTLNEENIALSMDVMEKVEELDKIKESKVQEYDHECMYKDQTQKLNDKVQALEKENIELSSDLTEQIEECDKLKETVDILKQQLDTYKNRPVSSNDDLDQLKQENDVLTNELIVLRSKMTQLSKENENLSILALNNSDEINESESSNRRTSMIVSTVALENSIKEDKPGDDISLIKNKVCYLEEQVEHLTMLNKKLSELKLPTCSQCAHLKELNESRRRLKLEVKCSNQKLLDLQKKFEQKCAEVEVLKTKANEDINTSLSLLETTLNGSCLEGINVSVMEEKVQNLFEELEEMKDSHKKLSNQYNEKCIELERLQAENISPNSPVSEKKRTKSDSRKSSSRIQSLQNNLDSLNNDLQDLKRSNTSISETLGKFMAEKKETTQEIESLKLANEELKKECGTVKAVAHNYQEKAQLLEEELSNLYKRVEDANAKEMDIQSQKLELEVKCESLLKELTEADEKYKKDIEDYNNKLTGFEKENAELKNEINKLEEIVQNLRGNNQSIIEDKLQEEVDLAKSRMVKEIKSLSKLSKEELKLLSKKSVTDIFVTFVKSIMDMEQELIKKMQQENDKIKNKLIEEKRQSDDGEKRANMWAKTLETDLEKLQSDYTELEEKNRRLHREVERLQESLKEAQHENNQLLSTVTNLERDIHSLHAELDKKLKNDGDKESAISAAQEKERIARSKEAEWEVRFQQEKEEHDREMENLKSLLDDYKSSIEDLKNTVEGQDFEIEHLKNTISSKNNDYNLLLKQLEETQQEICHMDEMLQQLKNENMEKTKIAEEANSLLKIKCDLLTEYKTKAESWEPERENLRAQLSDKKMMVEKYKEEIHNIKAENQKQVTALQDKLSDEEVKMTKLNKQLAELKNMNLTMSTTIEEFKEKCNELQRENASLQRKVRNSTSKVRVETEMQELQDENRSLKNNLEGAYNRIKELQEDKVQVQHKLSDTQIEKESLEHELEKIKKSEELLRDKLNNLNLQKLREANEQLLREKNEIVREVEEKRMLIASNNQKLVEYGIEIDTLKKQKENLHKEKNMLESRINDLIKDSEKLQERIITMGAEKEISYKQIAEEKNRLQKEMDELREKNRELDEEMEELVTHIHKQENEIDELRDKLITGSSNGNLTERLRVLEEENEKLKIDLRVNEVNTTKLQNEIVRLNTDKEFLQSRIEDLNNKIGELEHKNASRSSSKSNSPTTQKNRRRSRRSFIFNQNRNIDEENHDSREIADTDSPTPPLVRSIDDECQNCYELRNKIREMSLNLIERNNKITMLEVQLQAENFPYQMKCNELQENLLSAQARNSELKLEIRKLQRALMKDSSRECHICRQKSNKRDQAVQVSPESKISLTGMSSGIVEEHLKLQKVEKERNLMKDLCKSRARRIKELEQQVRELEALKTR